MAKSTRVPKTFLYRQIREKCLDCCAGQHKEVDLCPAEDCPIWMLRYGSRSIKLVPKLQEMVAALPQAAPNPLWQKNVANK